MAPELEEILMSETPLSGVDSTIGDSGDVFICMDALLFDRFERTVSITVMLRSSMSSFK